jgi:hypothetical protein
MYSNGSIANWLSDTAQVGIMDGVLRIEAQLRAALTDPTVPENHHTKSSARQLLEAYNAS